MVLISSFIREADLYIVNLQYIMLLIETTVLITFIILGFFYYLFVEKMDEIIYMIGYNIVLTVNQYSYARFSVTENIDSLTFWHEMMVITKITSVFLWFLLGIEILKRKQYIVRIVNLIVYFLCVVLLTKGNYGDSAVSLYTSITIVEYIYIVYMAHKKQNKRSKLGFILAIMYSLYFVMDEWISHAYNGMVTLDWFFVIISINIVMLHFFSRYKKLLAEKTKLYEELVRDIMTGVYTKAYFLEKLENKNTGKLLFIDINHFKKVNDEFGHHIGDALLKAFGNSLQTYEVHGQIPARIGGDEFMLYVPDEDSEKAKEIASSIVAMFVDVMEYVDLAKINGLGVSIGIANVSNREIMFTYSNADEAMYQAKREGNNIIRFYEI